MKFGTIAPYLFSVLMVVACVTVRAEPPPNPGPTSVTIRQELIALKLLNADGSVPSSAPSDLETVLAEGNTSGANDVVISQGQGAVFVGELDGLPGPSIRARAEGILEILEADGTADSPATLRLRGFVEPFTNTFDFYVAANADIRPSPGVPLRLFADNTLKVTVGISNVTATVPLNPSADNTLDLGSDAASWRTGYFDTSVVTPQVEAPAASSLTLRAAAGESLIFESDGGTYEATLEGTTGNLDLSSTSGFIGAFVEVATYTVGTLPSAATAGRVIYVSDGAAGSPVLAFSNGSNWLRCDTLAAVSGS